MFQRLNKAVFWSVYWALVWPLVLLTALGVIDKVELRPDGRQ